MDPKRNRIQKGFSLIEVMLSVLVLSVGILAVSKLQTNLIRSGADANQRSVAANLIQKKTNDLRRFVHLTTSAASVPDTWSPSITSPNSLAYKHIADNAGGLIGAATITIGNINYGLSWTVQDFYYSGVDAKATTSFSGADYPSYKTAHIVATWDSVSSVNNVVSFDTIIAAYSPTSTALGSNTSIGNDGPIIPYDPEPQPDVLPITISDDGIKRETSKPLLELSRKGDSTLVTFETVTYTNSLDTVKREEFRTLVCKCKTGTGTPDHNKIYGLTTWDAVEKRLFDVTYTKPVAVSKTLVDNSGGEDQVNDCFICCRDGEDTTSGATSFKVCRAKRVDGILRLFKPWKLVAFNAIPQSYFDDDEVANMTATLQINNIATYSNYVTNLVRGYLQANTNESDFDSSTALDASFKTPASDFVNINGSTTIDHTEFVRDSSRNIQARGVYLDYPPSGIYTTQVINGTSVTYSATNVPLDRIPFFEVNLTELAGWVPDVRRYTDNGAEGDIAFITTYTAQHDPSSSAPNCNSPTINNRHNVNNDELKTGCETKLVRGRFNPPIVGASTVETRIYTNTDGVVNRTINSNNPIADSSVSVTVSAP